jgi:hypothetical protein
MNTSLLVVIEKTHPHFEAIKNKYTVRTMDEAIASYETYDLVIDLTILTTENKLVFLRELARTTKALIISDLTITFQDRIFHQIPQVKASVSSFFYTPTNTIEFFLKPNLEEHIKKSIHDTITDFFTTINLKSTEAMVMEITFVTPRVVSQIINEAYFALDELLASKKDIDLAMVYGVNYPEGPIAWGKKTGINFIHLILEELYIATGDARYRPALSLKKESL